MILWEEVERESFFLMVSESGGMRIWRAEGLESEVQIGRKELIREKKREKKFHYSFHRRVFNYLQHKMAFQS